MNGGVSWSCRSGKTRALKYAIKGPSVRNAACYLQSMFTSEQDNERVVRSRTWHKRESQRPNSSCQVGQIFAKLCAYENDNSPIKNFNEPLAFVRVPSHSVRARPDLLCACAASPRGLSRRLLNQQQHRPR